MMWACFPADYYLWMLLAKLLLKVPDVAAAYEVVRGAYVVVPNGDDPLNEDVVVPTAGHHHV